MGVLTYFYSEKRKTQAYRHTKLQLIEGGVRSNIYLEEHKM